jgi:hypothetical protein
MCTEHIGLPLCGNCGLDYDQKEIWSVYGKTWTKMCESAKKETNTLCQRCRNDTSRGPPWTGQSR